MEVNPNLSEKAKLDLVSVEKALQGDQKAFATLHERYYTTIYFLVLRMVKNPTDAEDLTCEAFGKAFRNIRKYVPMYAFSSWLFRIATNNCIDFIRKKSMNVINTEESQKLFYDAYGPSASMPSELPTPEEHIINKQSLECVRRLMTQLKPQYQHLVELRYFEEYTYEELSVELELPMGTVKAQLYRAREMLQELLKGHDNPLRND
jgi:RNA polymerase sigma factor, sigma-70 family